MLLALPGRRVLCLLVAAGVAGAILAPPALVHAGTFVALTRATAAPSSSIFQPWQIWWFLGHHGAVVRGTFGRVKPGYRTGPAWTGDISHPLILAVELPLGALLWWRRRRQPIAPAPATAQTRGQRRDAAHATGASPRPEREALLLLALLLLLRCMLDTWDTAYYLLPFLLALTTWETRAGARGLPALALASTALAWFDFEWLHYTRERRRAGRRSSWPGRCRWPRRSRWALYAPATLASLASAIRAQRRGAHATTVSSFGSPLSTGAAVVGHGDEVLDAHADAPRDVDAGLDRHDVPGAQRLLGGGAREPRRLVDLQAHAVAEAVAEVLAVARPLDDLARDRVDLASAAARAHRAQAGELRAQDELVDLAIRIGQPLAGRERPRAVRAVAARASAPQSIVTSVSRAIATSRASACGNAECGPAATIEGKLGALAPEAAHAQLEVDRDVALGAPDEAAFEHAPQRLVGELRRRRRMRSSSAASLSSRRPSTSPAAGDQLPALPQSSRRRRCCLTVSVASSNPRRPPPAASPASPRATASSRSSWHDLALVQRRELLRGLRRVAEVREEPRSGDPPLAAIRASPLEPVKPVR